MPTLKPRISITLDPEHVAVLDRYAAASGTPRASFLAGLIGSAVPELKKAAELIELANAAPRQVQQDLIDNLANATADAMGFLAPFHGTYSTVMSKLGHELSGVPSNKRKAAAATGGGKRSATAGGDSAKGKSGLDPHSLTGGSK